MELTKAGRALRAGHVLIAAVELVCLWYVWLCALTNRRGRALGAAVATLGAEGIALVVGRGDCPLGPLQERMGDPVPMFELVLPRRAAKAAVPTLVAITCAGLVVLAARDREARHLVAGAAPAGKPGSRQLQGVAGHQV